MKILFLRKYLINSYAFSVLSSVGVLCFTCAAGQAELPSSYLQQLPDVPGNGCFVDGQGDPAFFNKIDTVADRLNEEIARRNEIIKAAESGNSKTMQEAMMPQPGTEGVDGQTLKQMSREAKRKMAEQMMEQQFGVSMEELKKLKGTSQKGQEGWGKAMMGQLQADAAMDPEKAAKTMQGNMKTAELAQKQADLALKIQAAIDKWDQKIRLAEQEPVADTQQAEMEKIMAQMGAEEREALKKYLPHEDDEKKRLRIAIKVEVDKLGEMVGNGTAIETCKAMNVQRKRVYAAEEDYCAKLSPALLEALNGLRTATVSSLPDAEEMEKTQMTIQKVQFGMTVPPEQVDMAGLDLVRSYIQRLRLAYIYDLTSGPYKKEVCDGALGR